MTEHELLEQALTERVRKWQTIFQLDHWEIKVQLVDNAGDNASAAAAMLRSADYDIAELHYARPYLLTQTPYEMDITICHELMHVHLRDLDEAVGQALERLSPADGDAVRAWLTHESEGIVDRLARVVVQAQPDSATVDEHDSSESPA